MMVRHDGIGTQPLSWPPLSAGTRRTLLRGAFIIMGVAAPTGNATVSFAAFLLLLPLFYKEARGDATGRLAPFGTLALPALALVAVAFLSTLFSADFVHSFGHVLLIALMAATGLMFGRLAVREQQFFPRFVMPLIVAATAGIAVYALYEYFFMDVRRATALLSYTNRLATLLAFFGILGAGYLLGRRGRLPWLLLPYGLLVMGGLGATMSRAGWVAAAVGLFLLALRGGKRALIVVLIAVLAFGVFLTVEDSWLSRFQTIYSVDANQSRLTLWQAAAQIFRDHPVIGTGPGSFLHVSEHYVSSSRYRPHATPHNIVLTMASDMGILGLAAFFWLIVRAGRGALFLWRRGGAFYTGLVAATTGIFVNELFSQGFYTTQIGPVMWLGLGTMAALSEYERAKDRDVPGPTK